MQHEYSFMLQLHIFSLALKLRGTIIILKIRYMYTFEQLSGIHSFLALTDHKVLVCHMAIVYQNVGCLLHKSV